MTPCASCPAMALFTVFSMVTFPWPPKLPALPWLKGLSALPWPLELPDPPWPPELPASPCPPELPDLPWRPPVSLASAGLQGATPPSPMDLLQDAPF
ncbi:hypothetical protein QQF64_008011 [Cirrhinus molitorella]|uniref:Secreted protein n=1 Tax=Cirrhinus molitorella TaxID=172907 RepID=A0ABR3M808_9TELE